VKMGPGHAIYEQIRDIEAGASGRPLTPEETARIEALERQSRELYDSAYRDAGGDVGPVSAGPTPAGDAAKTPPKSSGGDAPQQETADLDALYAAAAVADPELRGITQDVAAMTGGTPVYPPGLKGRERATQKIEADYGGDPSRLLDLSRASIEFEDVAGLRRALGELEARGVIVRTKDRFENPTAGGYRDVMLNVRMSNGHICELQLHLKQILEVKMGPGHAIYEQIRDIEAGASGRPLTPEETARIEALERQSRELYDSAYRDAGGDVGPVSAGPVSAGPVSAGPTAPVRVPRPRGAISGMSDESLEELEEAEDREDERTARAPVDGSPDAT
jgi:hypothetical protein